MFPFEIIFIVGPTAVGKSAVAGLLAKKNNGEIVSCDSMQVYKEVVIASNQPAPSMLKAVPHHLIGIISVKKNFDVARFERKALSAIEDILSREKTPIVTGGSGLYMSVLLDGIFKGKKTDPRRRAKFTKIAEEKGNAFLYEELMNADPAAALKIHPNDRRRMMRALEVLESHQQPISELQKKREGLWGKYGIKIFALTRNRNELYQLIDRRVDQMFEAGLVQEVGALKRLPLSLTAQKIIGVKEIFGYLNGEYNLETAQDLLKMHTRRYAKRQWTWFRKDKRLHWMTVGSHDRPWGIAERIFKEVKKR